MLIPPPDASQQVIRAHPYPIQIGYQTQQFLHAHIFHAQFQATCGYIFLGQPNAVEMVEREMLDKGGDPQAIALGWECLTTYQAVFSNATLQSAIVALNSHWDWYVRRLGEFVRFARQHVSSPSLKKSQESDLAKISRIPIIQQLSILEDAAGVSFALAKPDRSNLEELSLVRNLILHNRCEVDDHYLSRSACKRFEKNHLREVDSAEGHEWQKSLLTAVQETCVTLAQKFVAVPGYSHL